MAPRLTGGKGGKRGTLSLVPPAGTQPPPPAGDNSKALEEAERVQLISFISRLTAADAEIEKAKAPYDAAKKARAQVIGYAKGAGFSAKELVARQAEMNTPTRVMAANAQREHKHRRWLGILDDEQSELMLGDKAPDSAKDEAHWKGEGYKAGLRQMPSTPPPECPQMWVQSYMREHERGHKEVLLANAPAQSRPTVAQQAAADFKADNPDAPEPGTPEAKKAERTAIAKARESLEKLGTGEPASPDDGFEATEEELRQQVGRAPAEADVV